MVRAVLGGLTPPLGPAHPTREQVAVQLFYGNGRGPDGVSARRGWGIGGGLCVRVWVFGGGGGLVVVVVVDVNVTPTPSNAPDPEQMAGQGLSAEPELIACAMSYCLRPPPPKLPKPPAILIFAPRTPPQLFSPHPPLLSFLHVLPLLSSQPPAPAGSRPLYSFTHSPFHSFTCGLIHRAL